MASLDINTPKGQISLNQEQIVLSTMKRKYSQYGWDVVQTPKERDGKCDGFIVVNGIIQSAYEMKCRENLQYSDGKIFTYSNGRMGIVDSWLVTYEKLQTCNSIASSLKVPFVGFLYIVPSQIVFQFNISDMNGNWTIPFEVRNTKTQRTTNGGNIMRDNAYLPFEYSSIILTPEDFI